MEHCQNEQMRRERQLHQFLQTTSQERKVAEIESEREEDRIEKDRLTEWLLPRGSEHSVKSLV